MLRKPARRTGVRGRLSEQGMAGSSVRYRAEHSSIPRQAARDPPSSQRQRRRGASAVGTITQAIGHFENVTNVTSESVPSQTRDRRSPTTYTLQINSDFFNRSTACAGSPKCELQGLGAVDLLEHRPPAPAPRRCSTGSSATTRTAPGPGLEQSPSLELPAGRTAPTPCRSPTNRSPNMAN